MSFARKPFLAGLAVVAAGGSLGYWRGQPPTRLTFLSVGQGDCTVFQTQGVSVLIDAGPKDERFDAGEKLVLPALDRLGVRSVDLILLSHPDTDHIGGVGALVKHYPGCTLAMSAVFRGHPQMVASLKEWGVPPSRMLWIGPSQQVQIGSFTLSIRDPKLAAGGPDNDGSMFIRLSDGRSTAVLSGDAGSQVEQTMSASGDWSAQVLKAGHHGSRTASSDVWLRVVHPKWDVISCGRNNRYGHPHRDTLIRIERSGAKALRTDQLGDISFVPTDHGFVPSS